MMEAFRVSLSSELTPTKQNLLNDLLDKTAELASFALTVIIIKFSGWFSEWSWQGTHPYVQF